MIPLPVTSLPHFTTLTTFLINLLLQNFTLNPNIRTIAVYHDNLASPEFINTILENLTVFNKPLIVVDLNSLQIPESTKLGHQIVHLFLWKHVNLAAIKLWSPVSLIENSETLIFVFEEPQDNRTMQHLSRTLWSSNKLFNVILVFQDFDTKDDADLVVFRPFKHHQFATSIKDVSEVIQEKLYGTFSSGRIDMKRYPISVLMIVRPPYVMKGGSRNERFDGRDGKMAAFLSRYYNARFRYVTTATTTVLVVHQDGKRSSKQYVPVNSVQDSDMFVVDDEVRPV